jgi:transcriptional regulator with XRE-family HTH domain
MGEVTVPSAGEASAAFSARLRGARRARGWSLRELAEKSGVGSNTIFRTESGAGIFLDRAARLAAALGLGLDEMTAPGACGPCGGMPPAGFTCNACGATGPEAASDGR